MSKININISARGFFKQVLVIALAVGASLAFNAWFPQEYVPKDFMFKCAVYMLIYILVALVVESAARKLNKGGDGK